MAERIARADLPGVALTGAGISVESGIPDFRSPGGLWERFPPERYATIEAFLADPEDVWRFLSELEAIVEGARPNAAHAALARLESMGRLRAVVTQNVDGLHQAAGQGEVVEFHGSGRRLVCLGCGASRGANEVEARDGPPRCPRCARILKPDVVLFGEIIPEAALRRSRDLVASASFLLVVGTSAVVFPASDLPYLAAHAGVPVIEVNVEPTVLTGSVADVTVLGRAGEVLPELVSAVEAALGGVAPGEGR